MKNILLLVWLSLALGLVSEAQPRKQSNSMGKEYVIAFPKNDQAPIQTGLWIYMASSEDNEVLVYSRLGLEQTVTIKAGGVETLKIPSSYEIQDMTSEDDKDRAIILSAKKPISVYAFNSRRYTSDGYMAIPTAAWGDHNIPLSYYGYPENGVRDWPTGFVMLSHKDKTKITINLRGTPGSISSPNTGRKEPGDEVRISLGAGQAYMFRGQATIGDNIGSIKQIDFTGSDIKSNNNIGLISFVTRTTMPQPGFNSRDHLVEMNPPVKTWGKTYITVATDRKGTGGKRGGDMFRFLASQDGTTIDIAHYNRVTGVVEGSQAGYYMEEAGDWQEYQGQANIGQSWNGILVVKADKPILMMQYIYSAGWDGAGLWDPAMALITPVEQFTRKTIYQTPSTAGIGTESYSNLITLIVEGDADPAINEKILNTLTIDEVKVPRSILKKVPGTNVYWGNPIGQAAASGAHTIESDARFGGYIYGFATWDSYFWPAAAAYEDLGLIDTLPPVVISERECGLFELVATELRDSAETPDCDTCRPQVDQLIDERPEIDWDVSYNFVAEFPVWEDEERVALKMVDVNGTLFDWQGNPMLDEMYFDMMVEDLTKDAFVKFYVSDSYDNITEVELFYEADKIEMSEPLDFGKILFETDTIITRTLTSLADSVITYSDILIEGEEKDGFAPEHFEFLSPTSGTIGAGESIEIQLKYTANREYLDIDKYPDYTDNPDINPFGNDGDPFDGAVLTLQTECIPWAWDMWGRGGKPYMNITDWKGGSVGLGIAKTSGKTLKISNYNEDKKRKATWTLEISGIDVANIKDVDGTVTGSFDKFSAVDEFALDASNDFVSATIKILAGVDNNQTFQTFEDAGEFISNVAGEYLIDVPFNNNDKWSDEEKRVSRWNIFVGDARLTVGDIWWDYTRVLLPDHDNGFNSPSMLTSNGGHVSFENTPTGTLNPQPIYIIDFGFLDGNGDYVDVSPSGDFKIMRDLINTDSDYQKISIVDPDKNVTTTLAPEDSQLIPVEYTPSELYQNQDFTSEKEQLYIKYKVGQDTTITIDSGAVQGQAFMPQIAAADYNFGLHLINGNNVEKTFIVENPLPDTRVDELYIYDMEIIGADASRFEITEEPVYPVILDTKVKTSEEFKVEYTPSTNPNDVKTVYSASVRFLTDVAYGTDGDPRKDASKRVWSNEIDSDIQETEMYEISAENESLDFTVTDITFNAKLKCLKSDDQIIITNNSTHRTLRIDEINPVGSSWAIQDWYYPIDASGNRIAWTDASIIGQLLAPNGGQLPINVKYDPSLNITDVADNNISIDVVGTHLDSKPNDEDNNTDSQDEEQTVRAKIDATYFPGEITFGVKEVGEINIVGDRELNGENNKLMPITAKLTSGNKWSDFNITRLDVSILYHSTWFDEVEDTDGNLKITNGGLIPSDWTVKSQRNSLSSITGIDSDSAFTVLKITAFGNTPINGSGNDLFYPHLSVVFGDLDTYGDDSGQKSFKPKIYNPTDDSNVDANDYLYLFSDGGGNSNDEWNSAANECVVIKKTPGLVSYDICVADYRALEFTDILTTQANVRNNKLATSIDFDFGINADISTKVEVFDASGSLIATPINKTLGKSYYEGSISTSGLSSGVYFVRITRGSKVENFKLMVDK
jgi:IgGFc binding protein